MSMRRYMVRLSYLGNNYRGSQKHSNSTVLDVDSIQGAIESCIQLLRPKIINPPNITLAGRTDAGVHALCTTGHMDFMFKSGVPCPSNEDIIKSLNRHFMKCGHEIRIYTCHEVSRDFHARFSAKKRSYIYRFLYAKDQSNHKVPMVETARTMHLRLDKMDFERMKRGLELFRGVRDFKTFSAKSYRDKNKPDNEHKKRYIKSLDLSIEKADPLMPSDPLSSHFDFYQFTFTSRSFLYNQIRRIVGALFALSAGRISEEDIVTMLQVPSHNNWNNKAVPASPCGLYLKNVEYDEEDTKEIVS